MPKVASGRLETVAVRVPAHPVALALIRASAAQPASTVSRAKEGVSV
ncbi:MAG: hypothetical protein ACE5KI_02410 [Dehalococcoidia bacterium]